MDKPMVNQVTSIEQSKRLIELGVPVEKASMVWDTISLASHPIKILSHAITSGEKYPTIHDVVRYVKWQNATGSLFDDDTATSCMSYYGLCE